jgi:Icc-related predicted phosphoesterase
MIQKLDTAVKREHRRALEFLKWHVSSNSIVITHHIPTTQSLANNFKHDPTNVFFVCDMEKLIKRRKPKLWVHGHTHHSANYLLGKTHIVCNPFGYLGKEINAEFIPNMMLDV